MVEVGVAPVEHKDVVVAVLGVAAGLSGLVLVFLGLVVSAYQSYAADAPQTVRTRYRRVALGILAVFLLGMACVVTASFWLFGLNDNHGLYIATVWLFVAQVIALLAATGWTVARLMWGD